MPHEIFSSLVSHHMWCVFSEVWSWVWEKNREFTHTHTHKHMASLWYLILSLVLITVSPYVCHTDWSKLHWVFLRHPNVHVTPAAHVTWHGGSLEAEQSNLSCSSLSLKKMPVIDRANHGPLSKAQHGDEPAIDAISPQSERTPGFLWSTRQPLQPELLLSTAARAWHWENLGHRIWMSVSTQNGLPFCIVRVVWILTLQPCNTSISLMTGVEIHLAKSPFFPCSGHLVLFCH